MSKIMLIEDDKALSLQTKAVLESYQYEVVLVINFQKVEQQFQKEQPDLVILDINLPYYDGNYYCRMIRKHSKVPIIITSARNSDMDQILSIELGADDYVIKPFTIPVLIAKVNALLRRSYGEYASTEKVSTIEVKGIQLDLHKFEITYKQKRVELSKNEFRLMKAFLLNPDTVISRETLLEGLWDTDMFVDDNTLTVNVTRIKTKLQQMGLINCIKTKRGVGYLLDTKGVGE